MTTAVPSEDLKISMLKTKYVDLRERKKQYGENHIIKGSTHCIL
jgi:hypothetical protein